MTVNVHDRRTIGRKSSRRPLARACSYLPVVCKLCQYDIVITCTFGTFGKREKEPSIKMVTLVRTDFPTLRTIFCLLGIFLSCYALYVELSKEHNPNFNAMCDLSKSVSCSKVFTSKYGRGFGLIAPVLGEAHFLNQPNSVYGIIFFCLQMAMAGIVSYTASILLLASSILSLGGCVYLAYVLMFILEDACLVCISTYVVNTALFFINLIRWNSERRERKYTRKSKSD